MYRFFFVAVALLASGCQQQQQAAMPDAVEQNTREIISRYVELFITNDTDMIAGLIDTSFVCYHPAYPDNIVGRAGFRAWLELNHNAFPDLKLVEDEVIVKGDRAFMRWTFTGTQTGSLGEIAVTGRTMRLTGLSFIRVAGDKISGNRGAARYGHAGCLPATRFYPDPTGGMTDPGLLALAESGQRHPAPADVRSPFLLISGSI